ncbi:SixA phosphatase family protein [Frigidibacter oleivorans]|uniref:SixA phosphatase family protein n=1 Tax=Frigidibacter oleivorans TaxID=2487129 RepID=UPI000F8CD375|nr:histidine phosphatase family protein [Frigidibacter oleivorans]
MTRLILIRHAKSSWDDPEAADHDRRLNARGRRSAEALGHWLRSRGYLPDQVLCSSATRTRETLEMLGLGEVPTQFVPALYHAEAQAMLAELRKATGQTVMMLGHNPGIAEFAARLLAAPPRHAEFAHYPTGATLVADFGGEGWASADWGTGAALDFVVPRELVA